MIAEKSNASINCEIVTYILVAPHCQQSPMIWVREGQQVQVQSRGSPVRSPACPTTPPAAGINEISTFDFFICSRAIHHNQGRVCGPFPHTHIPPPAQGERNKLRPEICFSDFPPPWEFGLTNSLAICFLQMVVRKRTVNCDYMGLPLIWFKLELHLIMYNGSLILRFSKQINLTKT